jgi:hypothetical protein
MGTQYLSQSSEVSEMAQAVAKKKSYRKENLKLSVTGFYSEF